jgi:pyruvate dehydrogenase (quinone)
VKTDPDVAPLPPHVTLKEARGFIASIVKGDPSAAHMIADTARQALSKITHKD